MRRRKSRAYATTGGIPQRYQGTPKNKIFTHTKSQHGCSSAQSKEEHDGREFSHAKTRRREGADTSNPNGVAHVRVIAGVTTGGVRRLRGGNPVGVGSVSARKRATGMNPSPCAFFYFFFTQTRNAAQRMQAAPPASEERTLPAMTVWVI
jgi:hypothetical protein